MSTTNDFTVNGQLIGETGPNGIQYYHTDALGSVTMTADQNANVSARIGYCGCTAEVDACCV